MGTEVTIDVRDPTLPGGHEAAVVARATRRSRRSESAARSPKGSRNRRRYRLSGASPESTPRRRTLRSSCCATSWPSCAARSPGYASPDRTGHGEHPFMPPSWSGSRLNAAAGLADLLAAGGSDVRHRSSTRVVVNWSGTTSQLYDGDGHGHERDGLGTQGGGGAGEVLVEDRDAEGDGHDGVDHGERRQ